MYSFRNLFNKKHKLFVFDHSFLKLWRKANLGLPLPCYYVLTEVQARICIKNKCTSVSKISHKKESFFYFIFYFFCLSIHFIVFKSRIKLIHLKVEFYKILWVFNFIYTGIKQKLEKVFIVVERCKHKLHSFKLSWVVYFVFQRPSNSQV